MMAPMTDGSAPAVSAVSDGLVLSGGVSAGNVPALRQAGERLIDTSRAGGALTVDLSGLTSASSVLLSLLLCWGRYASHQGRTVNFQGASADLRELAQLNGVADILSL